jgi:UDP-N-acetylglucosamine 2-epimerase (non-hydrolysing)
MTAARRPLAIIVGTRPEIIKMSPLVRACQRDGRPFSLIHTGQHYSYNMDRVFFEQLDLPDPHHNLEVGSGPHGAQTARMLTGLETILDKERPAGVLVQGDTNSVVAGALAAAKLHIPVGHVEAGLRSNDRSMPEEINRIVADHVSDHLFAPTEASAATLRREGIPEKRIHVTGNTIVDAVLQNRKLAERSPVLRDLGLSPQGFLLMTAHRQENVDDARRFQGILDGAKAVSRSTGLPVVYPIHPRARKMLGTLGLDAGAIRLVEPTDFLGFLQLESNARLVLSDSGGVQEETCILGVPCVTLRDNTERPETVEVGANRLGGATAEGIVAAANQALGAKASWKNPFGDGQAAARILAAMEA